MSWHVDEVSWREVLIVCLDAVLKRLEKLFGCLEWLQKCLDMTCWHIHHASWQPKLHPRKLPMKTTAQPWMGIRTPPKSPHPHHFLTNMANLFLSLTHRIGHTPTIGIPLYVQKFSSLVKNCFNFLLRSYTHLVIKPVWKRLPLVCTLLFVTSRSQRCRRWSYITGVLEHTTLLAEHPVSGQHGWRSRDTIVRAPIDWPVVWRLWYVQYTWRISVPWWEYH